jgi:hypothetical protein
MAANWRLIDENVSGLRLHDGLSGQWASSASLSNTIDELPRMFHSGTVAPGPEGPRLTVLSFSYGAG